VRVLLDLLDAVGAKDEIVTAIAKKLEGLGVNTKNVFPMWEDTIVKGVREHLSSAQTALRGTLIEAFDAAGVDLGLATPKADVQLEGNDFPDPPADLPAGGSEVPEAQPSMENSVRSGFERRSGSGLDRARTLELLRALPVDGGEPMPALARARAEARFGEDFSHVRLHRGGRTAELAKDAGMRALTSGSHIVLGAGAADDPRLLYHELAHVVQQTGRGRAGERRTAPRRGRPGRGLRWDPRAEASADAAAAAALHGDARGMVVGTAGASWQPSLIQVLGQRFLRQITDITAIEVEAAGIEKAAAKGLRLIGKDVRAAVSGVDDSLGEIYKRGKHALHANSPSPYGKKLDEIAAHLRNSHAEIKGAIREIAIRASYQAERARKGKPARMALSVDDFMRRLERFIFGKTGILLELNADTQGRGRDKEFRHVKAPFTGATVKFVFLPPIHGNSPLWADALVNRGSKTIPKADRPEWRTGIRAVLRELGPSSSIWVSNEYRLTEKVFRAVEERDRQIQSGAMSGKLPPGALPPKGDYLTTDAKNDTGHGNQRLHLGTYDQKSSGHQKGTDRESHHITQYLLVEYFHNGSSTRALETDTERMGFPLLRQHHAKKPYGGKMDNKGARAQSFDGIKIAELEAGRGGKMPTILLARGTHRNGNLHISPRADDVDDTSTATQAAAVNVLYKGELPDEQRTIERKVASGEKPYSEWEAYAKKHDVAGAVESAMQATYAHIRKYMQKQLRTALVGIERDYYNDVYLAGNPAKTTSPMTSDDMNKIAGKAVTHNHDGDKNQNLPGMAYYGWTGVRR
jgi:hypothetical protein